MMAIQGGLYLLYLAGLFAFLATEYKKISLIGTLSISSILFVYEIIQMFLAGWDYWSDIWNIIDVTRFTLFTSLAVEYFIFDSNEIVIINIFLILVSWIRGLTYFRIFDSTRYLISLLLEVINDMKSFMILTLYSIIGLSLIIYSIKPENSVFGYREFLGFTYMTTIGEYGAFDQDVKEFNFFGMSFFIIASIVNTIVMMNLLISIIADTFDRVQQEQAVADYKQLGEMIYEIESLLVRKKNIQKSDFMQKLSLRLGSGEDEGAWDGKLRELKNSINAVYTKLYPLCTDTAKKSQAIDNDVKELKAKIEKLETNFGSSLNEINSKLAVLIKEKLS